MNENIDTFDVKIKNSERFAYAVGDFFGGGAGALITAVYFVFLALNGIDTALGGLIIMLAKIWDAVTDPMMGIISDNTRTKWGRRRPYIFIGAVTLIVSFLLLFLPLYKFNSVAFKFTIYLLAYLFYSTVSTVINVPYSALATELTGNFSERNKTSTVRLLCSMVSGLISAAVPMLLLEALYKQQLSVTTFSLIMIFAFGSFYTAPLIITALFTKERVALPAEKRKFSIREFVKPLKLKAFALLIIMYFTAYTCSDILMTNLVYLAKYGFPAFKLSSVFLLGTMMASYALTIPLHTKLMKTKSKAWLFRVPIPLYIAGIAAMCLYPASANQYVLFVFMIMIGVGMSGSQLLPWYIFPDIVDLGELKFKETSSGSYSGLMTFVRKSTSAIAIAISGLALKLSGFITPTTDPYTGLVDEVIQTESGVTGLRLTIMISVIFFMTLSFITACFLKVSPERSKLVTRVIKLRKEDRLDELDENELAELSKIEKELF